MKNRKTMVKAVLGMLFAGMFTLSAMAEYECTEPGSGSHVVKGIWSQDEHGMSFTSESGQKYADHWLFYKNPDYKKYSGVWCYFNADGYMLADQFLDYNDQIYYLGTDGVVREGWIVKNGSLYHGGRNKALYTNKDYSVKTVTRGSVSYTFDSRGRAISKTGEYDKETQKEISEEQKQITGTGWSREDSRWTYWQNGQKLVSAWLEENGNWYYLDAGGYMVKSEILEINGSKYEFTTYGVMRTSGTTTVNGKAYDIQPDGKLAARGGDDVLSDLQIKQNQSFNSYVNSQTVQWINATYALLTKSNSGNIKAFGGVLPINESSRSSIELFYKENLGKWWGVTDRASADRVLANLINNGNSTGSAWDFSRAESNLGYYYLAGYYTETEALDKALEVAYMIRNHFDSWDSYNKSYLEGYKAWSRTDGSERQECLDALKASIHNPFAMDWNLNLEKQW